MFVTCKIRGLNFIVYLIIVVLTGADVTFFHPMTEPNVEVSE